MENQPHKAPASLGFPTKITLRMSIHNLPDSQPCHQPLCGWGHTTNALLAVMWLLHRQGWCQELVWHPRKEGVELQCSQGSIHLPVRPWQDWLCWSYLPNSALTVGHLSGQGGRGQVCVPWFGNISVISGCNRRINKKSGLPYDREQPLPPWGCPCLISLTIRRHPSHANHVTSPTAPWAVTRKSWNSSLKISFRMQKIKTARLTWVLIRSNMLIFIHHNKLYLLKLCFIFLCFLPVDFNPFEKNWAGEVWWLILRDIFVKSTVYLEAENIF